jgi:WD40 repeat protein
VCVCVCVWLLNLRLDLSTRLVSSDQIARLWDLSHGESIRTYTGHTKAITSVALNDFSDVAI